MFAKHLLGATAVALVTAAGAAQAADAPVVVPVAPPAPVAAAAEPEVAVRIDAWLWNDWDFDPFDARDFGVETEFVVDMRRPSGGGFQLLGDIEVPIELPFGLFYEVTPRAYRSSGPTVFGVYGYAGGAPGVFFGFGFGWDIAYQAGNLAIYNDQWVNFFLPGFDVNNETTVEFQINDRVRVSVGADMEALGGPFFLELDTRVEFDLGGFTPYAFGYWSPTNGFAGVGLGVDVERPIGSGPLTLIGGAEVQFGLVGGTFIDVDLSIGIRYNRGEVNAPWWWDR